MAFHYVDGSFIEAESASLPVNDLAVLRGFGVFDFLRTYGGVPFKLDQHIERLATSARELGIPLPETKKRIREICMEALDRNDFAESNLRIVITGGISPDSITPGASPKLVVMTTPVHEYPQEWYTEGIRAITYNHERFATNAKTTDYAPAIMALRQAREADAHEALYVNRQGYVLEGTTSNFFGFIDDRLITCGSNILPGVTRSTVLDLAKDHFAIETRPIHNWEIRLFDECFLTASNKEIMPLKSVNGIEFQAGAPGPGTRKIMDAFRQYTADYAKG